MFSTHAMTCLTSIVLLAVAAVPASAITGTPSWKPRELVAGQLVDANFASESQLAFDHHGNPGIAFYDATGGDLRFARRVPGVGWAHGLVDSTGNTGRRPSLAFDRYERPAISYQVAGGSSVLFAHYDGSAWQSHVAVTGATALSQTLAFDVLGRPAIAIAETNGLRFVQDTDGDFRFDDETPVTIASNFVGNHELVFDPLNRPMIAYTDFTDADVDFAVEEPGVGWVTSTIDDATGSDYASIAIDPSTGLPVVAYERNADVMFATWNGSAWNSELVNSPVASTIAGVSLAFDPADGYPAIAYRINAGINDLYFSWFDGVSWSSQGVDFTNVGASPSLAFNSFGNGFPSIAYVVEAGTFDDLYFIEDPPLAVPEPATAVLMLAGLAAVYRRRTDITG
jgi:hypothetical protein